MREHKIISEHPGWVAPEKRESRFGGPMPPRKPEKRSPLLWLSRQQGELYLVNATDEPLELVIASSGGFQTVDDEVVSVSSQGSYEYHNVNPNQAVKVDEYDDYYDCDFFLQVYIRVKSRSLGYIDIRSPPEKGGVSETVILWDSGELGKYVFLEEVQQA